MSETIVLEGDTSGRHFDFTVQGPDGVVPATLWTARRPAPAPLTLLQHGGPFHKRHERSDQLAEAVAERTGGAVLLIDGPVHGRRRSDAPDVETMLAAFEKHWREDPGIDGMVSDWRTALDAVLEQGWADPNRVAWFGMSMGTAYGIPLCAAEPRLKAAVMGMWGVDWGHEARLLESARAMTTPTLFQIKSEDEFFPARGQRVLFDAIGSPNKCLHTYPGGHSLTAPGQLDALLGFLARAFEEDV